MPQPQAERTIVMHIRLVLYRPELVLIVVQRVQWLFRVVTVSVVTIFHCKASKTSINITLNSTFRIFYKENQ